MNYFKFFEMLIPNILIKMGRMVTLELSARDSRWVHLRAILDGRLVGCWVDGIVERKFQDLWVITGQVLIFNMGLCRTAVVHKGWSPSLAAIFRADVMLRRWRWWWRWIITAREYKWPCGLIYCKGKSRLLLCLRNEVRFGAISS